jgi:ferredoxin
MFKKLRVILALLSFIAVTMLFLDFTGVAQQWWGWIAKIQFVPAFLALNIVAIVFLLLLTIILGRAYCSVICPLGILQDIVIHVRGWFGKKSKRKNRFKYSKPKTWLRLSMLTIFVVMIILGLCNVIGTTIASFIEPYSAYGRIASSLFAPIYDASNNVIADALVDTECYWFYHVETFQYLPLTIIAVVTLLVIGIMAWLGGRAYCNTICPVGTILGYVSRYSLFKPIIDTSKCNGCTKCAKNCKSSCIDARNHEIDYSRCVMCMNCIENCSTGAIKIQRRLSRKENVEEESGANDSRRNFIITGVALAAASAAKASDKVTDGGLAKIVDKEKPQRKTRIVPPGAVSLSHLQRHCTGCQLCISSCPNDVLRPSTELSTFMQPVVGYEKGYCRPECVRCSDACPVGAFHKITVEEKSVIQIGRAVVNLGTCVATSRGQKCGNCADKCPTGAIKMVAIDSNNENSHYMPVVNESKCIGCGACEYYCPVRPISAIYVNGNEKHRNI